MTKPGRTSCCVPFCRRTVATERIAPNTEWTCANHWRNVPLMKRKAYHAEVRQAEKIIARKPLYREWWKFPPGSADRLAAIRMWKKLNAMWDELKTIAIERGAGI